MKLEKMTFEEFVKTCNLSNYEWRGCSPDIVKELEENIFIVRVNLEEDTNLFIEEETLEGQLIDFGEKVIITDWNKTLHYAFMIVEKIEEDYPHYIPITGSIFNTVKEAEEYWQD
jgi:hypothetical protein